VAPRPTLLFFTSERSGPSRRVEGFLAQVLQRRHNHDTFVVKRIDQQEHPELLERFEIDAVPALVLVSGSAVRGRLVVPRGAEEIRTFLAPWLR